jgi:hypothetical protein
MASMGYRNTIDQGNMMNSNIAAANRTIRANNSLERDNFKANLIAETGVLQGMKGDENISEAEERGMEGGALGKALSDTGDIARRGLKKYKQGQEILDVASRALGTQDGSIRPNGEFEMTTMKDAAHDAQFLGKTKDVEHDAQFLGAYTRAPVSAMRDAGEASLIIPAEHVPDVPEVSGLGKMGKGLAGFAAVEGAYDVYEDATAKTGTWGKKKGYEQVEDIANITGGVAGALELAGVGLDATVVGAPVGLIVGGVGALAGAVSFGTQMYGDTQKDKVAQTAIGGEESKIASMTAKGAAQQPLLAQKALGTTGAYEGGA